MKRSTKARRWRSHSARGLSSCCPYATAMLMLCRRPHDELASPGVAPQLGEALYRRRMGTLIGLKPGNQIHCCSAQPMSLMGLVSRVTPVQTAMRNCTRDEGRSFEVGNQVLISSHRKLLSSKAMVVNVAEKSERDFDRHD